LGEVPLTELRVAAAVEPIDFRQRLREVLELELSLSHVELRFSELSEYDGRDVRPAAGRALVVRRKSAGIRLTRHPCRW
jgi:hypothetical protein